MYTLFSISIDLRGILMHKVAHDPHTHTNSLTRSAHSHAVFLPREFFACASASRFRDCECTHMQNICVSCTRCSFTIDQYKCARRENRSRSRLRYPRKVQALSLIDHQCMYNCAIQRIQDITLIFDAGIISILRSLTEGRTSCVITQHYQNKMENNH